MIPNSVTTINPGAFRDCSSLTTINIPNGVSRVPEQCFGGCEKLNSIILPNTIEKIGAAAFADCVSLTSITIPDGVKTLDNACFSRCNNLVFVSIPKSINSIGSNAFEYCKSLADVYCYMTTLSTNMSYKAFENSYLEYVTLHIPNGLIPLYSAIEPWKSFGKIVEIEGGVPSTLKCERPTISYENGQLKMSCTTEGVEYVTDITNADIKKHYDVSITLTATYNISVYATKTGYENSESATATLCWIDVDPKTEGISNSVTQVRAHAVLIQAREGQITITGTDDGTKISVYEIDGHQVGSTISHNGYANLNTNIRPGSIAIIKIGDKNMKVVVK